jgi:hypothetical protein
MTFRSQPHARTPFARLVHALLLFAWLLSSQGVAPAFVLAAATMDGDHAVKVGAASNGDLTVVLAHDAAPAKEHDPLCALIVAFAANTSEEHPDHVLSFKAVEDASRRILENSPPVDLSAPFVSLEIKLPAMILPVRLTQRTLAPIWSPGLELKAAKTILLC